jgi:hypothetical protein
MAGQIKVDSINADSNLALKIANTAVAFIDSSGLRPVSGNVNLDTTATSKVYLPSANTVAIQTAGVTGLSMSSSQVVTLANALPVGSGGTGATSLSAITTGTATNLAGGSNGTIPYQSAAGTTQMLAVGTSGQVLQTNGVGAPTWATPSSGSLTFLSTVTASASATVDIETTFSSTYDAYVLYIVNLTPATAGTIIYARLKIGGSYVTSGSYTYAMNRSNDSTTGYLADNSAGDTTIRLANNCSLGQMIINIYSPSNTTKNKMINWHGVSITSTPNIAQSSGVAYVTGTTAAMTGIRIFADSGNITSGTFRLYGVSNS